MKLTYRSYQTEADFWRMREFLRQVFLLNDRRQRSWHVARLEYARWHMCANCANVRLEDVAFLWEEAGQLAAILMPDGGPGEAHLLIHPILRTPELEEQMLDVTEEHLATINADGLHRLVVWAAEQDELRQVLLTNRGYIKDDGPEYQWCRHLEAPVAVVPAPPATLFALWGMAWSFWSAATHQDWGSMKAISESLLTTGTIPPGIATSRLLLYTAATSTW